MYGLLLKAANIPSEIRHHCPLHYNKNYSMLGVRLYLLIIVSAHIRYCLVRDCAPCCWLGGADGAEGAGCEQRGPDRPRQAGQPTGHASQISRISGSGSFFDRILWLLPLNGTSTYLFGRLKDNICRDSSDFRLAG